MTSRLGICHICGCSENEVPKLFFFPKSLERSKIWQQNMGIKYRGQSMHNYRICSRHFTPESYRQAASYTLFRTAAPTLFPMTPDPRPASVGENIIKEIPMVEDVVPSTSTAGNLSTVTSAFQEHGPSTSRSSQVRKSYFRGIVNLPRAEGSPRRRKLIKRTTSAN